MQSSTSFSKFLLVIITICISLLVGCNPRKLPVLRDIAKKQTEIDTADAKESIAKSAALQDLDKLCRETPPIKDFSFHYMYSSNRQIFLTYYYYSPESYESIKDRFTQVLSSTGWQTKEEPSSPDSARIAFKSEKYWIRLYYFGSSESESEEENYAVECGIY